MKIIAITSGDPAGIGSEIIGKGLRFYPLSNNVAYLVYGQIDLPDGYRFVESKEEMTNTFRDRNIIIKIDSPAEVLKSGRIYNIEISDERIIKGQPSPEAGKVALDILERCVADVKKYNIDAVVTAPVSKEAISYHQKGFIGHTEYFAEKFSSADYVMNFVGEQFSLALLTTHCALSEVKDYVTKEYLMPKMRLVSEYAKNSLDNCNIALLSCNPHGGEGGLFGNEEMVLKEIITELEREGIVIEGPFPADSFFRYHLKQFKQVIAVYHDQGLIPFKLIHGERGVNTTLGLPVVRTSVDHGTAFDIADKNIASPSSFISALQLAEKMIGVKNRENEQYNAFAEYYDDYMSEMDWDSWFRFITSQCDKYIRKKPINALDIGCGTSLMANKLAGYGYQVEAIDASPQMLQKGAEIAGKMSLTYASFLSNLPKNSYDLVISLFDSVNYIPEIMEVKTFFENVYSSIKEKGLFIFDVTTFFNCEEHFDGCVYVDQTEDVFISMRTLFKDEEQNLIIDMFKNNGLFWSHSQEEHNLRIYPIEALVNIVTSIKGFVIKGLYQLDGFRKINYSDNIDYEAERIFFVVQKKK